MISYSSRRGDIICDFFFGSGTVPIVAHKLQRRVYGFEKNSEVYNFARELLGATEPNPFQLDSKIGTPEFAKDFEKKRKKYISHFKG